MELIKIYNREEVDDFLIRQKHTEFLQSFLWGELKNTSNVGILRFGVEKNGELLAVATLIKKKIGLGKYYYYCPRGPIFDEFRISNFEFRIEDVENFLFIEIQKIAKTEKVIFIRFEPKDKIHDSLFMIHDSIPLQPKKTLMMDLSIPEEEALKMMHQKTRYNIRLAGKKGVEIIEGNKKDFNKFWDLMNKTSDRDAFRIHEEDHYKKLLEIEFVKIFFAKFEGRVIAAGIFSFFGDTVTYMHGASSNEHRNVMAPFLLQWELIVKAKKEGYKYYDFYGIDENRWPGVTRFKKGFAGFEKKYPGTFDLVLSPVWYNIYKIVRKTRRAL